MNWYRNGSHPPPGYASPPPLLSQYASICTRAGSFLSQIFTNADLRWLKDITLKYPPIPSFDGNMVPSPGIIFINKARNIPLSIVF